MQTLPTERFPSETGDATDIVTPPASSQVMSGVYIPRRRPVRVAASVRRKKLMVSLLLAVVVLTAVPLGARAALLLFQEQRAFANTPKSASSVVVGATTLVPKSTDPDRRIARYVDQLLSQMSLQEELGQLIVVSFLGTTLTPDLQIGRAHV